MQKLRQLTMSIFVFSVYAHAAQGSAQPPNAGDTSPHSVKFVTVDNGVVLETLDWGGSGRALVFLSGMGATAHQFDKFVLKLTGSYHVYAITRRGFGASSTPAVTNAANYRADRLGDDVLEVCAALKLDRPVLVGHSIAGQELSSIGSRHPEKVAGLIYLDAVYEYAFYDAARGDLRLDSRDVKQALEALQGPEDQDRLLTELLEKILPQLERTLKRTDDIRKRVKAAGLKPGALVLSSSRPVAQAILDGGQKYTGFQGVPVLAICAAPRAKPPNMNARPELIAEMEADDLARVKAFENSMPGARVVRLAHANHVIYQSNEADVLREMNSFLAGLK